MYIKLYFITLPVFFIIDMVWLGLVANNFYKNQIGFIMRSDINWAAAIIFYLLYIAGLVFFVIGPAVSKSSIGYAIGAGALFGLITYATYDLTNFATLKNWPLQVTIVDLIWGTVLAATVSLVAYSIAIKIGI